MEARYAELLGYQTVFFSLEYILGAGNELL